MALFTCAKRLLSLDAVAGVRGMAITAKLPDLPYDFGALEPFISGKVGSHVQINQATSSRVSGSCGSQISDHGDSRHKASPGLRHKSQRCLGSVR